MANAHPEEHPFHLPEAQRFPGVAPPRLIVFDSGAGGLNVLKTLLNTELGVPITFIADSAWMPYGDKEFVALGKRLLHLISLLLRDFPDSYLLFACNTASAVWESIAPKTFAQHGIRPDRVIDILRPTVAMLSRTLHAGEAPRNTHTQIGLMATQLTVESEVYPRMLHQLFPPERRQVKWCSVACPGLADAVEDTDNPALTQQLLEQYLAPLMLREPPLDALIVGCTHYLALKAEISARLPGVPLIDPSEALAYVIQQRLAAYRVFPQRDESSAAAKAGQVKLFATGPREQLAAYVAEQLPQLQHLPIEQYAV